MGSTPSTSKNSQEVAKYGQIYVQTEKAIYYGGETVSGTIYIDLTQDFPGTQLHLKFKGKEDIAFWIHVRAGKGHKLKFKAEKNIFLQEVSPIRTWTDRVHRGQYAIPFSFLLPQNLPGSYQQDAQRLSVSKYYQVEAYIHASDPNSPNLKLKHKRCIVIREPLIKSLQEHTAVKEHKLYSQCCCAVGFATLKATFNKNVFLPGDAAEITFELDNSRSKLLCKKLAVYLKQTIIIKAEGYTNHHEIALDHKIFPGPLAGAAPVKESVRIVLPPFKRGIDEVDRRVKTKEAVKGLVDGLKVLYQVTTSEKVTSKYSLEVMAFVDYFNIIRVECPIDILYPELQVEKVKAPANWEPQTFESVNFALTSFQTVGKVQNFDMMNNNMKSPTVYPENTHLLNSPHCEKP